MVGCLICSQGLVFSPVSVYLSSHTAEVLSTDGKVANVVCSVNVRARCDTHRRASWKRGTCVSKARGQMSGARRCRDAEASNDRRRFGTGRAKAGARTLSSNMAARREGRAHRPVLVESIPHDARADLSA